MFTAHLAMEGASYPAVLILEEIYVFAAASRFEYLYSSNNFELA